MLLILDSTILSISKLISIIAQEDIITIDGLLHLSICHRLVKLLLIVNVTTRAELTSTWIFLALVYERLTLIAILMELWSCMGASHLLGADLGETLRIVSFKWWWVPRWVLNRWRWEIDIEWLHLSCLSISESLDTWDFSLVSLVLLGLSWAHHSAWTSRLRSTNHSWISILLHILWFEFSIRMFSIAHLSIEISIFRREESCSDIAMRPFIWVNWPYVSALSRSHISWLLVSHVRSSINIMHWKVFSFWLSWVYNMGSIVSL